MATWEQIKNLRLKINDPSDIIDIIAVANLEALPETPVFQTAYYVQSTGSYVKTDIESEASADDYDLIELDLSDARLNILIDEYGESLAVCKSYRAIATKLGKRVVMKSNTTGTERVEYTTLKEMYNYYKSLADDCESQYNSNSNNSTGRFCSTKNPEIAGGNI